MAETQTQHPLEHLINEFSDGVISVMSWYQRELSARPTDKILLEEFDRVAGRIKVAHDHCIPHIRDLVILTALINDDPRPAFPLGLRNIPPHKERTAICQRGLAGFALMGVFYAPDIVPRYAHQELRIGGPVIQDVMTELWKAQWDRPDIRKPSAWISAAVFRDQNRAVVEEKKYERRFAPLSDFDESTSYGELPQSTGALPFDFRTDRAAAIRAAAADDEEFASVVHELLGGIGDDPEAADFDNENSWRAIAARRDIPPGERKYFSDKFKSQHFHKWRALQRALWPYYRRHETPENWGFVENKANIV